MVEYCIIFLWDGNKSRTFTFFPNFISILHRGSHPIFWVSGVRHIFVVECCSILWECWASPLIWVPVSLCPHPAVTGVLGHCPRPVGVGWGNYLQLGTSVLFSAITLEKNIKGVWVRKEIIIYLLSVDGVCLCRKFKLIYR